MPLYLGAQKIKNVSMIGITDVNTDTTTNITGILKGENSRIAQAIPDVDYLTPSSLDDINTKFNTLGSLASKNTISELDLDSNLKETINNPIAITNTNSLLADTRIALGGALAAMAHQGGHSAYAEFIQADAFQDSDQIAENNGTYYRDKKLELLTEGLQSDEVWGNPGTTSTNAYYNVTNLGRAFKPKQQWNKVFDFYPNAFGKLTKLKLILSMTVSQTTTIKLAIQDTEAAQDVLTTELVTIHSEEKNFEFPVDLLLDPNRRYAMCAWLEEGATTISMSCIEFMVTPLVYPNAIITMKSMIIPAGTTQLELLVHDTGTASSASLKFDSGDFITLIQTNAKTDKISGGTTTTLRSYNINIPDSAQTAQLRLTLNDATCKIYDYALIAL